MEITIPKIPAIGELETFLHGLLYRKISEVEGWVTYQGPFEFGVARQNILLSARDFISFVRAIKVKNGYKRKRGDMLLVQPYRKTIVVRLSQDYQELLKKVAKGIGRKPTEHARLSLIHALQKALESMKWPEQEIPKAKPPSRHGEPYPVGESRLCFRISEEQEELLTKVAATDGLTSSQYIRMVLESGLPREATALGLIEKPQTTRG